MLESDLKLAFEQYHLHYRLPLGLVDDSDVTSYD
jgi:hypothetical protein